MAYRFGISDAKIALWTAEASWSTVYDLDGINTAELTLETLSGILEGDDAIKAVFTKVRSVSARIQFAFSSLNILALLTGNTVDDSPTVDSLIVGVDNIPYVGLAWMVDHDSGGGADIFFCPKIKPTEGFAIGGQYGQFITPQITMMGVYDGTAYGAYRHYVYDTKPTLTIPPPTAS